MAHLWIHDDGGWSAKRLAGDRFDLRTIDPAQADCQPSAGAAAGQHAALLVRTGCDGSRAWAMIAGPHADVRVNGEAPIAGLRVLSDRDEIRTADGRRYFFSLESLAQVQGFPGSDRPVFCGRCRQQIALEAAAVQCPDCGIWYDQSSDLPCWTYSDRCAFCGHSTALDSGFAWAPEDGLA